MHSKIMMGMAALALGTAFASAPAFAAAKKVVVIHPAAPSYSNTGPWSAPLSPNGISAAASAYGGPGYNGPYGGAPYHTTAVTYSNTGPWSAPLSPNGISAAASAYGGPGYNGPYGATAGDHTSGLYASAGGLGARTTTVTYSTLGPKGAPLSPNGISAAADAFGGPGYQP
jgi:hypothetical protein